MTIKPGPLKPRDQGHTLEVVRNRTAPTTSCDDIMEQSHHISQGPPHFKLLHKEKLISAFLKPLLLCISVTPSQAYGLHNANGEQN